MATKTKLAGTAAAAKAGSAASSARPYVERVVADDELRDNLRDAYQSGRKAYARAAAAKRPADVLEDKKLQKELRNASESLRSASDALREPEKSGSTLGRLLLIVIVGAILALALSEELRKTVLDKLFGAEEEFEYTSTTSPSASEASPAA